MALLSLILPNVWTSHFAFTSHSRTNSMCHIGTNEDNNHIRMSPNNDTHSLTDESMHRRHDIKQFVDLYTAALHLRQRMKEEGLIRRSYSAHFDDENNNNHLYSLFHNCFHSSETVEWLIKKQLCKTVDDGQDIFQVLSKLKIVHHVCDLNEFEYPSASSPSSSHSHVKYLYRFRLDDGTGDENPSFQQFATIYETYISLFTLDKSQCRGVDLQAKQIPTNPYDEKSGILLKGDNLGRMLALRSGTSMSNVERMADDMILYGLVRSDDCDEPTVYNCLQRFRSDDHHQYILSNAHVLLPQQRLDLIALMQSDISHLSGSFLLAQLSHEKLRTSSSNSSIGIDRTTRTVSSSDEIDCTTKLTCSIACLRRKKSSSLNSPANPETRPTAEELERRELPWSWRSYSLKRDRRGYGLILQGQGPCYIERLDPYGSSFNSGIRVNEYLYAIEGINVLRRSGKEVERLLSMFDKCTVYTIYNRDDFCQIATPPNEINGKNNPCSMKHFSSSLSDYSTNRKALLGTVNCQPWTQMNLPTLSYSSSPPSSVDESSSCSISPKHLQQYSNAKKGTLARHFQFFRLTSRSCSNTLK